MCMDAPLSHCSLDPGSGFRQLLDSPLQCELKLGRKHSWRNNEVLTFKDCYQIEIILELQWRAENAIGIVIMDVIFFICLFACLAQHVHQCA